MIVGAVDDRGPTLLLVLVIVVAFPIRVDVRVLLLELGHEVLVLLPASRQSC
jgi:hypothetical protein